MTNYKSTSADLEYFAAVEDPVELANRMTQKIREWREWCASKGLMGLWKNKLTNYYGRSFGNNTSMAVTRGGSEGELSLIKVNDLRNLLQNQLVITTGNRPAGIAKAINSDTDSLKSAKIATTIAEYYMSQVGFEANFVAAAETALLLDEAYIELFWNKEAGDPIAVDHETGQPEMSGDCIIRNHCPWNVARDTGLTLGENRWYILSYKANKFDVACTYPKFSDRIILNVGGELPDVPMDHIPDGSDAVFCHLLIHDRTACVPNGRYTLMIAGEIVLDTELPYKPFPVERISAADVIDANIGYSASNDLMGLEQITDALHSIITSNEASFGANIIIGPNGLNINHEDLAKGLRYMEGAPGLIDKVRVLELCKTPPEIFNYIEILNRKKQQFVGVNSVVTGQLEGQLSGASGSALALIQAQAISFNSGIQRSYFRLMSGVMTKLIEILRTYADTPRVAKIVGKSNSYYLKQFKYTGKDLNSISSIVYELTSPVLQTLGGKLNLADTLIERGQITSPRQYLSVAATGNLDVLTQDDENIDMLIIEENEAMIDGESVSAVFTENHKDHIQSHKALITKRAKESDPDLINRVGTHIQEHLDIWQELSMTQPALLLATGQEILPPPPMMGLPMQPGQAGEAPGPEGPPGPPGPEMPGGLEAEEGGGESPATLQAQQVDMPNLPKIAGTNERPTIPGVSQ